MRFDEATTFVLENKKNSEICNSDKLGCLYKGATGWTPSWTFENIRKFLCNVAILASQGKISNRRPDLEYRIQIKTSSCSEAKYKKNKKLRSEKLGFTIVRRKPRYSWKYRQKKNFTSRKVWILWIRILTGSVLKRARGSGSRPRKAKITHKKKKFSNFVFWRKVLQK